MCVSSASAKVNLFSSGTCCVDGSSGEKDDQEGGCVFSCESKVTVSALLVLSGRTSQRTREEESQRGKSDDEASREHTVRATTARPFLGLSLASVTLKKVTVKEKPVGDVLSVPIDLSESNFVGIPEASLKFEVSEYPSSKWAYWHNVVLKGHNIGLQFHQAASYHLELGSSPYEIQSTKRLSLKEMIPLSEHLIHRVYEITEVGCEPRTYDHFSLKWEDLGLPSRESFLQLMRIFQTLGAAEKSAHVHCMAGRGRSGVFVYTAALLGSAGKDPDLVLKELRSQRPGLVETLEQELFSNSCAQELLR